MEALHDFVEAGEVRYIKASSMYAWQFSRCSTPRGSRYREGDRTVVEAVTRIAGERAPARRSTSPGSFTGPR